MALGIAALRCSSPVTIKNAECVDKSYPLFWEDLKRIGGDVVEQHMGE
jgi:3-phosphoshikimate 1-carboxyvinyltransferase